MNYIIMWWHFVEAYNGGLVIRPELWSSSDKDLLFTDASGAVIGGNWFAFRWEEVQNLAQYQIPVKKMFPIV